MTVTSTMPAITVAPVPEGINFVVAGPARKGEGPLAGYDIVAITFKTNETGSDLDRTVEFTISPSSKEAIFKLFQIIGEQARSVQSQTQWDAFKEKLNQAGSITLSTYSQKTEDAAQRTYYRASVKGKGVFDTSAEAKWVEINPELIAYMTNTLVSLVFPTRVTDASVAHSDIRLTPTGTSSPPPAEEEEEGEAVIEEID